MTASLTEQEALRLKTEFEKLAEKYGLWYNTELNRYKGGKLDQIELTVSIKVKVFERKG
jgi:hypothetical protein